MRKRLHPFFKRRGEPSVYNVCHFLFGLFYYAHHTLPHRLGRSSFIEELNR